jgi:ribose transport system ATP-binding protein
MEKPILRAEGIIKKFPGVVALDNVEIELFPGEVHIIVGENGAGKSTLSKCLLGAYIPDSGNIYINDKKVSFRNSKDALAEGITAVYQEFNLVPYLNVAQNIFFTREYMSKVPGIVDSRKMHEEAGKILKSLNVDYIDTRAKVKTLGVAEQQMVEIAKALSTNPKILVFDEPTAPLSEREVEALFKKIHQLKKAGIAIIYVSHRMHEFEQIGDRITVLRDGKYIGTVKIDEVNDDELVKMMVGRDISQVYHRTENSHDAEALRVENLCDKKGKVKDVNFYVKKGEIVGLAGLVGAGRTETAKLIFGIDDIHKGKVYINGEEIIPKSPVQMTASGVGLLPEDRKGQGLAIDLSVAWNILAVSMKIFFPKVLLSEKKVNAISDRYAKERKVATPSVDQVIRFLSGGNQQKVVIGKWLSTDCDILIFDEPTRGIDVGAKMEIYALLDKLAAEGKAILMISSELQEVIGLSDRIYVLHEGSVAGEFNRGDMTEEQVAAKMLGVEVEE